MSIDLAKIIELNDLDKVQLARDLFPNNKFSSMALARVIKGEALLNSEQLAKLAHILDVTVDDLYNSGGWKMKANKADNKHIITFEAVNYKAELDTKSWLTKIYHKNSLFHESIIIDGKCPINEYLETINNLISNFKNNVKN